MFTSSSAVAQEKYVQNLLEKCRQQGGELQNGEAEAGGAAEQPLAMHSSSPALMVAPLVQ